MILKQSSTLFLRFHLKQDSNSEERQISKHEKLTLIRNAGAFTVDSAADPTEFEMNPLAFSKIHYQDVKSRIQIEHPGLDEETLADTIEGLTSLPDIVEAI